LARDNPLQLCLLICYCSSLVAIGRHRQARERDDIASGYGRKVFLVTTKEADNKALLHVEMGLVAKFQSHGKIYRLKSVAYAARSSQDSTHTVPTRQNGITVIHHHANEPKDFGRWLRINSTDREVVWWKYPSHPEEVVGGWGGRDVQDAKKGTVKVETRGKDLGRRDDEAT
jgi:hypothetical protein